MNAPEVSPFFGAYNARHLIPEQVARQFVPSEKFWMLTAVRNSLIVGPRGSGKTHMLKMLQPKALAAWIHDQAPRARRLTSFRAIFVAADVTWRAQVEQRSGQLSAELGPKYRRAVFILHVREAIVSCMLQLTHDRPAQDSEFLKYCLSCGEEAALVGTIAESWRMHPKLHSLVSLRQHIVDTLSDFRLAQENDQTKVARMVADVQPDVLSTARQAIEAFNAAVRQFDAGWALCFDELEIAPPEIQEELFECLRSTDQRLLFKLAISPFNAFANILNKVSTGSVDHDYDAIPLWFTNATDSSVFCQKLWEHKALGTAAEGLPPWVVLQRSKFHYYGSSDDRYSRRGAWTQAFVSLAEVDQTFARYLKEKGIRASALDAATPELRDQVIRKVAPLVGYRNAYLKTPEVLGKRHAEKRKIKTPPSDIFSGWEAVCLATEGNPRWFGGLVSKLILRWEANDRVLSRPAQAREFTIASQKFLAWISAVPVPTEGLPEPFGDGIRGLVESLGKAFRLNVLEGEFTPDPVLAFTLPKEPDGAMKELLVSALNVGAIVSMNEKSVDLTLGNLRGHKFRLVHLLAPIYKLPLRTGEDRALQLLVHRLVNGRRPKLATKKPTSQTRRDQKELF